MKVQNHELETISWNEKVTRREISSPPKMPTSLRTGDLTQGRSQLDKPVPVEISAPSPSVSNELTCCCCTIHKNDMRNNEECIETTNPNEEYTDASSRWNSESKDPTKTDKHCGNDQGVRWRYIWRTKQISKQLWHGAKKKKVFGDLKLAKMLFGASERTNLTASQKETEDAIKKWLRRAKERSQQKQ